MELETIKKHLKVTHSFEDDLIEMYAEWAKSDVLASVTTSDEVDMDYVKDNFQFQKAVILLTNYYFDQRLTISDKKQIEMPYGVQDAIQKLRGDEKVLVDEA